MTPPNGRSQWTKQIPCSFRIFLCGLLVFPWLASAGNVRSTRGRSIGSLASTAISSQKTEEVPDKRPDNGNDTSWQESPTTEQIPQDITPDTSPSEGHDCYIKGCPAGMLCTQGTCLPNPCQRVQCAVGKFCRQGECVKACGCLRCLPHEVCWDGVCQANLCAGVLCTQGQICDANSGLCVEDLCASVTCGSGRICRDGRCADDPCLGVECLPDQTCRNGQCFGNYCAKPEPPAPEPIHQDKDEKGSDFAQDSEDASISSESQTDHNHAETSDTTSKEYTAPETFHPQDQEAHGLDTTKPETTGDSTTSSEMWPDQKMSDTPATSPDSSSGDDDGVSVGGCGCSIQTTGVAGWWLLAMLACFGLGWRKRYAQR